MDPDPYDVFAVELSSFQLHYTDSMSAESAAVLNVAEDHLDWYSVDAASTPPTRAGSTSGCSGPASTTSPTPRPSGWSARPTWSRVPARSASPSACPASGCSAWSRTSWPTGRSSRSARPAPPSCARSPTSPRPRPTSSPTRWPPRPWPAPTASPRPRSATGCAPSAPTGTGSPTVAEADGVTWVDDSKATNPHAAQSSLQGYDPVVWVAGGLAKGARFDDLVTRVRDRLRGVVLLGRTARSSRTPFRDTRPMCPSSSSTTARLAPNMAPWSASSRRLPGSHGPATRCCWLPDAPPWTCSPTTAHAATPSPRRSGAGRAEHGLTQGRGGAMTTTADPPTSTSPRRPASRTGFRLVRRAARRAGPPADVATTCCSVPRRCCSPSA